MVIFLYFFLRLTYVFEKAKGFKNMQDYTQKHFWSLGILINL